ncbi:MAG: hypothetical protein HY474_01205 [Candidatus Sungbacteria bacterium]|uniref:Uncharacterized protein n=1 Tax=Candidatus Sungiibacteriota bacterium TaxID=2750080 RepID=A0A932YVQ9_9BACT|nr:hypothetical protein [Candidatus Sungbacteria bacterium]
MELTRDDLRAVLDPACREHCAFCRDGDHTRCTSRACGCQIKAVLLDAARGLRPGSR